MIISGFAGIGKTYFAKNNPDISIDLESSNFKWIFDGSIENVDTEGRKGLTNKTFNPEWPLNYIQAIKDANAKYDFVFISMDKDVREILKNENFRYFVAFPILECKEEYILRYKERKNGENFINLLETKYDEWINDLILSEPNQIRLHQGEFIWNKIGPRE